MDEHEEKRIIPDAEFAAAEDEDEEDEGTHDIPKLDDEKPPKLEE